MDITREQLFEALEQSSNNPVHYRITQQILSVDDFMSFKRMMIKKNIQINEIAMNALMKQDMAQAAENEPDNSESIENAGGKEIDAEEEQMRIVMEMSMAS